MRELGWPPTSNFVGPKLIWAMASRACREQCTAFVSKRMLPLKILQNPYLSIVCWFVFTWDGIVNSYSCGLTSLCAYVPVTTPENTYLQIGRIKNKWKGQWGDLLRSVPCITVWHQRNKSQILWAREKSIRIHISYWPLIIKIILGHLPDLIWKDRKCLHFLVCHTVTFSF